MDADPHRPNKNEIEIGDEFVLQICAPKYEVKQLEYCGQPGAHQSYGLDGGEGNEGTQVVGKSQDCVLVLF